jgi:hypothetical protein
MNYSKIRLLVDESTIRQHLAEADEHIATAEARITRQREIVAKCSAAGRSTEEAEELLAGLTAALKTMLQIRQQSLAELSDEET